MESKIEKTSGIQTAAQPLGENLSQLKIGQKLGPYEVISHVGAGGMGEIYLALDSRLGRKLALKLLPAELTKDPDRVRRFRQEARAASAFNHPNVATIYEIDEAQGLTFIAMEYVDGETLGAKMKGRALKVSEILEIGAQIADALQEAHAKGIVHRDIKPGNIMLTPKGQVKMLDFGLAKMMRPDHEMLKDPSFQAKTRPGFVMGTVKYMSPEQALGKKVDHRTDLFSFGVLLYEMATGHPPFNGSTAVETIDQILHAQPDLISRYNLKIPSGLEKIIGKCLEKDRDNRYRNASELLADLKSLKHDSHSMVSSISAPYAAVSRRLRPWGMSSLVISLAMGVAAFLLARVGLETATLVTAVVAAVAFALGIGSYLLSQAGKKVEMAVAKTTKSIAVLPFKPLTDSGRDDALELGMTDTLITRLSRIREIIVPPISAVRKYNRLDQDSVMAGGELKVDSVIDGNMQRAGDRLRVSVRLVNIKDGAILWTQTFNEKFTDIFAVQDAISERVVSALSLDATSGQIQQLTKHYTDNVEAYGLYTKGRYYFTQIREKGLALGIDYFNQALEIDPQYALAYAGIADAYSFLADFNYRSPKETIPKSKEAAIKALEIDDMLAEAHSVLAYNSLHFDWNWDEAEKSFKRTLELNPHFPHGIHQYTHYLMVMGRMEEALSEIRRALEMDRVSMELNNHLALHYYYARQYDQAVKQCEKAIELEPNIWLNHHILALVYDQKKMFERAIGEAQKAIDLSSAMPDRLAAMGHAYAQLGQREKAMQIVGQLHELTKQRYVSPYFFAVVYAGLKDKVQVFEWLEKGYEDRSEKLVYLKLDPIFDDVRSEPQFENLLKRIGLPQ